MMARISWGSKLSPWILTEFRMEYGGFHSHRGTPSEHWMVYFMEFPIKMDEGVPPF